MSYSGLMYNQNNKIKLGKIYIIIFNTAGKESELI